MDWPGYLRRRRSREEDLDRELRAHLELEAEERREVGLPAEEARQAARRAFGNLALAKEAVRESWEWSTVASFLRDLRHAARMLFRSPVFTGVAALSLAIGIGASTSVFTIFHALFLRPLPVHDPDRLRILNWTGGENSPARMMSGYMNSQKGVRTSGSFSFEILQSFQRSAQGFSSIAGFSEIRTNIRGPVEACVAPVQLASGNYFETVGITPLMGRAFGPAEDSLAAAPVVVLSWRLWKRLFGETSPLGASVTIERVPYTVIGVMPPRFVGLSPASPVDMYIPLSRAEQFSRYYSLSQPDNWWVEVVGRLAPGQDERQARTSLDGILARTAHAYASKTKERVDIPSIILNDGRTGMAFRYTDASQSVLTLFGMVAILLLTACANVANLMLARGGARAREFAVRISLGAGRLRLIGHLFTESLLLGLAGGALGLLLARAGTIGLARLLMPDPDANLDLRPDAAVLAFTIGLSLLTAVLFGIAPAIRSTKVDPAGCLKQGGAAWLRQRFARTLIAVQIAMAFVLVFGAGLFARTLNNLGRVDLGFRPTNLLLFYVDASRNAYKEQRLIDAYQRIRDKVARISGVRQAACSRMTLIAGGMSSQNITVPGRTSRPRENVLVNEVSDGFAAILGMPVVLGRDLLPSDNHSASRVALVNQALAAQYFSGNPLGREFSFGRPFDPKKTIRVVGVTADAKYYDLRKDAEPTVYLPFAQFPDRLSGMTFELRTAVDPLSLAGAVRRAVAEVDPTLPVADFRTQEQQILRTLAPQRTFAFLASFFGGVTLLLAGIGVYGMLAYAVARRTSEFGVRLAVGATGGEIRWLVLRGVLLLLGIGIAAGLPAALAAATLVRARLFGVEPADTTTIVAAAVLLSVAAVLAAWMPARKAALLDPVAALRYE